MNDRYQGGSRQRGGGSGSPGEGDGELQKALDSLVLEAIENIVTTSRRLRAVQSRRTQTGLDRRQQERRRARHLDRAEREGKVTRLRAVQPPYDAGDDVANGDGDYDEDTYQLPGMTDRQRVYADRFAQWLMQQDNYPIILQHVEELLMTLDDDSDWDEQDPASFPEAAVPGFGYSVEQTVRGAAPWPGHAVDQSPLGGGVFPEAFVPPESQERAAGDGPSSQKPQVPDPGGTATPDPPSAAE
jgi:hypothetical protein